MTGTLPTWTTITVKSAGPAWTSTDARAALAVTLLLLLAGCSDPAAPKQDLGALSIDDVEVETTQSLGGIRGVVVDAAIRPIVGANLTLVGSAATATTDEGGIFTFDNLEPGAYFVTIEAPRFIGTQTSAEVVAGQVTDLRILLAADESPVPTHETLAYEGFIDASAPLVLYLADIVLVNYLNQSVCDCWWVFQMPGNITTVVFEMVWKPTSPVGANLYYQFAEHECDEQHIHSKYVTSPYVAHIERDFWQVDGCDMFDIHFGGRSDGINVNQAYKSFTTMWRNGPAPAGWSVANGGA